MKKSLLAIPGLRGKLFYGWVIVLSLAVLGMVLIGTRFSFGVFFKPLASEFGLSRTTTSAIFSVYLALASIFAFVAGQALDRYGPRWVVLVMGIFTGASLVLTSQAVSLWHVFFTYSLMLAIGTNSTYVVAMTTVSRWFHRKRGMAQGLANAGVGAGTAIAAPFAALLVTNLDWRMAYVVMGVLAWLILIPLSRLLRKDPGEMGLLPYGDEPGSPVRADAGVANTSGEQPGFTLGQATRTRSFWLIIFIWLLYSSCLSLIMIHIVPHVTDLGFSPGEAASVLGLVGWAAVVGKISVGTASDKIGGKRAAIVCAAGQAAAILFLIQLSSLGTLRLFAMGYGLFYGGMAPSMASVITGTFGTRRIGSIFGTLEMGFAVGSALGPALGGLIFDTTNSYVLAFSLATVAMAIVTLLVGMTRREVAKAMVPGSV